ncbi:MAG: hypothetical protein KAY54_01830 [Burkholderiaceae bacterium]|nr:hypothetical protein [Burkholderiaceae bacterium]
MKALDIRLEPRRWSGDELRRHDELPGRLEMVRGQLCLDEEQRLVLLGALLEHVGTARAVQMGPLKAWTTAIAEREELEAWNNMPAVGREQFWRPPTLRLSFKQRLELKKTYKFHGLQRPKRTRR